MANLPFDQFQRYKPVSLIIDDFRNNDEKFSILEIGANEHQNLEKFLPQDNIKYLDIKLPERLQNNSQYILGDATSMPEIVTKSFDIVIALDVFEHIPKELREKFLTELNRVSKKAVILAGPFNEDGVHEAEFRVNEYFKTKFGMDYIWLYEHIHNGLPSLGDTINFLKANYTNNISHFKHGSLNLWEDLIRLHFEVADNPLLQQYRQNIDNYYNKHIFSTDVSEMCYRDFLICSAEKKDYTHYFNGDAKNNENLNHLNNLIDSTYRLSVEKRFMNIKEKEKEVDQKIYELHNLLFSSRIKKFIKKFIPN